MFETKFRSKKKCSKINKKHRVFRLKLTEKTVLKARLNCYYNMSKINILETAK